MTLIYGKDSLVLKVAVTNSSDSLATDLTSATFDLDAKRGSFNLTGTVAVTNAAGGLLTGTFAADSFYGNYGIYKLHLRMTLSGNAQTIVAMEFTVDEPVESP